MEKWDQLVRAIISIEAFGEMQTFVTHEMGREAAVRSGVPRKWLSVPASRTEIRKAGLLSIIVNGSCRLLYSKNHHQIGSDNANAEKTLRRLDGLMSVQVIQ